MIAGPASPLVKIKAKSIANSSALPFSGSQSVNSRRQIIMLLQTMITTDRPINVLRLSRCFVRTGASNTENGNAHKTIGPIQRMCSVAIPQK